MNRKSLEEEFEFNEQKIQSMIGSTLSNYNLHVLRGLIAKEKVIKDKIALIDWVEEIEEHCSTIKT